MTITGIYAIRNVLNDCRYIGSSVDVRKRFGHHRFSLRQGTHDNSYLQRAWQKYGEQGFVFELLELTDKSQLAVREQFYFEFYHPHVYNVGLIVASPFLGIPKSIEHRQKIGESHRGRKCSVETRLAMSRAQTGVKRAPQSCDARARSAAGIKRFYQEHPRERKTHCVNGHPYNERNSYWRKDKPGKRMCRACGAMRDAKRRKRSVAA